MVYEEVVDGGITRLAAVYQSAAPGRVGPSARCGPPTRASCGRCGACSRSRAATPSRSPRSRAPRSRSSTRPRAGPLMFRDPTRQPPHNLYADVAHMYGRCADPAPRPLFAYRRPHAGAPWAPASSVRVGFAPGYEVTWTWDAGTASWQRSIFGGPEVSAAASASPRRTWSSWRCPTPGVPARPTPRASSPARAGSRCSPPARSSRAPGCARTRPAPARLLDSRGPTDHPHAGPHLGGAARRGVRRHHRTLIRGGAVAGRDGQTTLRKISWVVESESSANTLPASSSTTFSHDASLLELLLRGLERRDVGVARDPLDRAVRARHRGAEQAWSRR